MKKIGTKNPPFFNRSFFTVYVLLSFFLPKGLFILAFSLKGSPPISGKVFASQERVSGFPEKGLTSGEVRETSGEVRGTSREVWETSRELLDCCKVPQWENLRGSRRKTSGEVAEKLPEKFGELPGKSGDFPEARGSLTPSQRLAKFVSNNWEAVGPPNAPLNEHSHALRIFWGFFLEVTVKGKK